ncbi:MAG: UDP-N-acetylmuramoyl-L-alanyl-D-glutamate--2,6-diaminopimelate ligase [Rhodospirillaceae bacterium]|nr:UDP-N-acetylmuramoyl-L-alanyl-D-glutamate--2,6-diaminopimelate ligase [Rhodospirillaceae bacterium]
MLRLAEVLKGNGYLVTAAAATNELNITGITCDSRRVEPGYLFAAIPGTQTDGRRFISNAIERGAVAVLAPAGTLPDEAHPEVSLITDDDPRRLYALMAARFFERQPASVAAITGTSGKTSTAHFLRQIWIASGLPAGSMGTLGIVATDANGADLMPADGKALTTPDAADLHRQLRELAETGVEHLAMEASSHGLDQRRLDGVRISAAAFTNLSHDHLDYHGTESAYLNAKIRLFSELLIDGGTAVINGDQAYADTVIAACRGRGLPIICYGSSGDRVRLISAAARPDGQQLQVNVDGVHHDFLLPLVGEFQASNALCALALALATGSDPDVALNALAHLKGAPGRMERIGTGPKGGAVYVDYAHKPDALERALQAFRPHTTGRLSVVFGCGGDRDAEKRPIMGRIAETLADTVIVTDDNPRGEDAAAIRRAVMAASPSAREIGDRGQAISTAIAELQDGDVLVVAGKGHETGQIVGDETLPFNDAQVISQVISQMNRQLPGGEA